MDICKDILSGNFLRQVDCRGRVRMEKCKGAPYSTGVDLNKCTQAHRLPIGVS